MLPDNAVQMPRSSSLPSRTLLEQIYIFLQPLVISLLLLSNITFHKYIIYIYIAITEWHLKQGFLLIKNISFKAEIQGPKTPQKM